MIFSEPSRFIGEIPDFEALTEAWTLDFDNEDPF